MVGKERASVGLDDDDQIDIEEIANVGKKKPKSKKLPPELLKAGQETGFVSRPSLKTLPRRGGRAKYSPYQKQFGGRCREGMKDLFREAAVRLDMYDSEALELAVLALIEKHGFDDLMNRYFELTEGQGD